MSRPARAMAILFVTAAAAVPVAGCGIAAEERPRDVAPPPGYEQLVEQPPAPAPAEPGGVQVTIYFTRDGAAYPVERAMEREPGLDELMASLHRGPTEAEQSEGIVSVLPGANITEEVDFDGGRAKVGITVSPEGTSRNDIYLAFAQVVCTLDARPEVTGVFFVDVQGQTVGVPTADEASPLNPGPVTAADYGCQQPAE